MFSVFTQELRLNRRGTIIWSAIMLLTVLMAVMEFSSLKENLGLLSTAVEAFPRPVRIVFGIDAMPLDSALGLYVCIYYWYALITFAYATHLGLYAVGHEERYGTADYLFTKPLQRSPILAAKFAAGVMNAAALPAIAGLGSIALLLPALDAIELTPQVLWTTLGMFLTQLVFLTAGMLCAAALPNYQASVLAGFGVLLAAYVVGFILEAAGARGPVIVLSPTRYFFAPDVTTVGLDWWFALVAVALVGASAFLFGRAYRLRDLRA